MSAGSLVVFDYDGVIVDSLPAVLAATREFCNQHGISTTIDAGAVNKIENLTFSEIARTAAVPQALKRDYGRFLFDYLATHADDIPLIPSMGALIREVSEQCPFAIVSANQASIIRSRLGREALDKHTDLIMEGGPGVRKSEQILHCVDQTGADTARTWMVGDAGSDVHAARKAGVGSIAVAWGWQDIDVLSRQSPDHLVNTVDDLRDLLHRLLTESGSG
jgi:phosphoglycolate phosphatase